MDRGGDGLPSLVLVSVIKMLSHLFKSSGLQPGDKMSSGVFRVSNVIIFEPSMQIFKSPTGHHASIFWYLRGLDIS